MKMWDMLAQHNHKQQIKASFSFFFLHEHFHKSVKSPSWHTTQVNTKYSAVVIVNVFKQLDLFFFIVFKNQTKTIKLPDNIDLYFLERLEKQIHSETHSINKEDLEQ